MDNKSNTSPFPGRCRRREGAPAPGDGLTTSCLASRPRLEFCCGSSAATTPAVVKTPNITTATARLLAICRPVEFLLRRTVVSPCPRLYARSAPNIVGVGLGETLGELLGDHFPSPLFSMSAPSFISLLISSAVSAAHRHSDSGSLLTSHIVPQSVACWYWLLKILRRQKIFATKEFFFPIKTYFSSIKVLWMINYLLKKKTQ